jgi:hypothetical protein
VYSELPNNFSVSNKKAKKKDIDRFILSVKNKNKALWKLTNKETGNSQQTCNIIINNRDNIITNPQIVSDRFHIFFEEVIQDLLSQNNCHCIKQNLQVQIKKKLFYSNVCSPCFSN